MIKKKFDELRLTGALPSPSAVGLRILEITKDDDYDQDELTRTIMADPALSGRIIKVANSALNDGGASVESVPQAAMRLGSKSVRSIALGFTLISDNRSGAAEAFDYDKYWSQALATAVAANFLAFELGTFEAAEAFTCGLLADIGSLALASVHPERYSSILEAAPDATPLQVAELEERAFDIDHYEVSAAMLEDWGFSQTFQTAVLMHDKELGTGDTDEQAQQLTALLRTATRVAILMVRERDHEDARWCGAFLGLEQAAEELGMEHDRLLDACDSIALAWEEWSYLIGVPSRPLSSFRETQTELEREGITSPPADAFEFVGDIEKIEAAVASPDIEAGDMEDKEQKPVRILLIDDDLRMLKLIRHHLRREGYEVITAESSEDGLHKALDLMPQIVITDWLMPGMTGVKLCETLRQSEAGRKMYVLIVTAREDDERVVEAFSSGADDYIVKPFNPRILLARVRAGQRMIQMREQVEASERVRLRQVAELGIMTRKLRAAAMTDPLTELPNRRYAMNRLKQEWNSSKRTGRPLSVVVVDIDHFKGVNDQHGHDVGDLVLREVATVLRTHTRSGDVLCRVGGGRILVHQLRDRFRRGGPLRRATARSRRGARLQPSGVRYQGHHQPGSGRAHP